MKRLFSTLLLSVATIGCVFADGEEERIITHKAVYSPDKTLLSWYKPDVPGAAYSHVAGLAAKFLKDVLPEDEATGLKYYYLYAAFDGFQNSTEDTFRGETHRNNPACVAAGLTESLAVKYYMYGIKCRNIVKDK